MRPFGRKPLDGNQWRLTAREIASPPTGNARAPLGQRLLWMAVIWAGSVLALFVLAGLLRLALRQ